MWDRPTGNSELPFSVLHEDRIYFVTDSGVATCVDPANGNDIWKKRIGGDYTSSPVVANDLVYFFDDKGKATVVRADDEYEVVAVSQLSEGMRSSPAVAYGALYLRTFGHLYKIAAAESETVGK
jgi:outer membrane protein assembly factor BamB